MINKLYPPECEGGDSNALGDSNVLNSNADKQELVTSKAVIEGLTPKELVEYNEKLRKRGIVYMSRVPPFMKPAKVKHLLGMYGEVTRIYLVPEDASDRRKRRKGGGNRGMRWKEAWVEFAGKKVAKAVARGLNNTQIGGKKRDFYREDIWNLKYLKGFKWDHLTEKVAYERRMREAKIRMEMLRAKKESETYVAMLDKKRAFEEIEKRKPDAFRNKTRRGTLERFKQSRPVGDAGGNLSEGLLSEVFSGGKRMDREN